MRPISIANEKTAETTRFIRIALRILISICAFVMLGNLVLTFPGPGGKFCVSVIRQNQEYHIINVHDGAYSPWLHPSRKVGAECAPRLSELRRSL